MGWLIHWTEHLLCPYKESYVAGSHALSIK